MTRDLLLTAQLLRLDQITFDTDRKLKVQEKVASYDGRETCGNRDFELAFCFTSSTMDLRTYQALACQLVDRVVETYVSARLDLIAEGGSLFVIQ